MPDYKIEFIAPEDTYPLRNDVLAMLERYGSPALDGDDELGTFHLGTLDEEGNVVCIATLLPRSSDLYTDKISYQLRGMATDPDLRGTGIGSHLLARGQEILVDRGVEVIWADSREIALKFYERAGWKVHGERFDKAGIPHFAMGKLL